MTSARLSARPGAAHAEVPLPGVHPLRIAEGRDALLGVPPGAAPGAPLLVALHGAGGSGRMMAERLAPEAARRGLLVLAPDSRGTTWDAVRGGYGPDVVFLDEALAEVFARVDVGPVAVAGFSDGASYALSIGLANGDLFADVLAWSPGFLAAAEPVGRPRVYVSHGTHDDVLPIDRCSRRLVPFLRAGGYDVTYDEFDGGHVLTQDVLERSLARLVGTG